MSGWDGAGGQVFGQLSVTLIGNVACSLDGPAQHIALVLGSASHPTPPLDIRYIPDQRSGLGSARGSVAPAVLLEPGQTADLVFLWSNWCGASFNRTLVEFTLSDGRGIIVPGPGTVTGVEPARCEVPAAPSEIVGYAFRVPEPDPDPPVDLDITVTVPAVAHPGDVLDFEVRLINQWPTPRSLDPCPSYREAIVVNGTGVKFEPVYLLNCAAIGSSIGPGAELALAMRFPIPADVPTGPAQLSWSLLPSGLTPIDGGGQGFFTITAP